MQTILILTLLALAASGGDAPPKYSYAKSVMVDPDYKSSWSAERIRSALEEANRPLPRLVVVEVPVERVRLQRAPCFTRPPLLWWGVSFRFRHQGHYGHHHRVARCR